MGIVNVTPDSFSDGGAFFESGAAVHHGLTLATEGAGILDVGGESTRPYATPVPLDEELRRTQAVVAGLCQHATVPVSIDTTKASVARGAIAAGAEIINDISSLEADTGMLALAAETGAGVCIMHMQGTPQTMQDNPQYADVVREVYDYLARRRDALLTAGIAPERIAIDPGIGFGKTHEHNIELLAAAARFHGLGHPVLIGHSRKGFIGKVLHHKSTDRDAGTIGVALALAAAGIQMVRVHQIAPVQQALALFAAVGGIPGERASDS